jgi:hypothetical protein
MKRKFKHPDFVVPAQAGTQGERIGGSPLDPRFRGGDGRIRFGV